MAKLSDLTLEQLYDRPKLTQAVVSAITSKEDFSSFSQSYCNKVCKLKCKNTDKATLLSGKADVLIVQDHREPAGKFDKFPGQQDTAKRKVIDFIVNKAGADGLICRVTSLLKCPASDKDFPNERPPSPLTLMKCSPYLVEEIKRLKPKVIISLGTATTKALGLSKHSNTGNRGHVAVSPLFGIPVVMTLHPRILTFIRQNARGSGGMWGPDFLSVIVNDFSKAMKIARGEVKYSASTLKDSVERAKGSIKIARSVADAKSFMDEIWALSENKLVSFDTETTNLDVHHKDMKLLTIQFGWISPSGEPVARVIPLWHRANSLYNPDDVWGMIAQWLESDRPKIGHNAKYDILAIYFTKKVRVKNVRFDTLLLLHSINSGIQGTYGLKAAVWDHLFESGLGGYEDLLGSLKDIKKQREAEKDEEA